MTLTIVSEKEKVKRYRRFAKMRPNPDRGERPRKQTKWSRVRAYLTESLIAWARFWPENHTLEMVDSCKKPSVQAAGTGGAAGWRYFRPIHFRSLTLTLTCPALYVSLFTARGCVSNGGKAQGGEA